MIYADPDVEQLARERGLFASRSYNFTLMQAVRDDDIKWKGWARIQSAQQ